MRSKAAVWSCMLARPTKLLERLRDMSLVLCNDKPNACRSRGATAQEVISAGQTLPARIDWIYPVVFFILMLFSMIAAHKIPSDSVFFIWALIISPIITFLIGLMGTILSTIFSKSAFVLVTSQMPITSFMITPPVPMISAVLYQLLVIILLYAGKNE